MQQGYQFCPQLARSFRLDTTSLNGVKKFSSEIVHPADTAGKYPQRFSKGR